MPETFLLPCRVLQTSTTWPHRSKRRFANRRRFHGCGVWAKAKETLKACLEKAPQARSNHALLLRIAPIAAVGALLVVVAILGLIASIAFRGGAVFHLSGLALVTANGSPASRARLFGRSVLTWMPVIAVVLVLKVWGPGLVLLTVFVLHLGGAVWCVLEPERGPQDRLAGTWLVPK